MTDDVLLNKAQIIKRCTDRIHEEYRGDANNLAHPTKQDSIILNIQRACEATIDLAMHVVAERHLGVPQSSRDAFDLLHANGLIPADIRDHLKGMVGFRNIAVHDYRAIDPVILQSIIDERLTDLKAFCDLLFLLGTS